MRTREEVLKFGLFFPDTYQDAPFHDPNWQLVWRNTYESVLPGYHQNKEHWNTVILDGTVPKEEIKRMIAESYDLVVK